MKISRKSFAALPVVIAVTAAAVAAMVPTASYAVRPPSPGGSTATDVQCATTCVQDSEISSVDWSKLVNIPADLADGDDNTTYTAGAGLSLTGTEFSSHATAQQGAGDSIQFPITLSSGGYQHNVASVALQPSGSGSDAHLVLLTGQFQAVCYDPDCPSAAEAEWQIRDDFGAGLSPVYSTMMVSPSRVLTGSVSFLTSAPEGSAATYNLWVHVSATVSETKSVWISSPLLTAVDLGRQ